MSETNKQRNKDRQTQPHKSYNLLEGFLGFRALGGLGFTGFDAHTRTKAGKAPHRFMGLGLRTAGSARLRCLRTESRHCPTIRHCRDWPMAT